jgi:hypothetical protein
VKVLKKTPVALAGSRNPDAPVCSLDIRPVIPVLFWFAINQNMAFKKEMLSREMFLIQQASAVAIWFPNLFSLLPFAYN